MVEIDKDILVKEYLIDNLSLRELAKKYNTNHNTIKRKLIQINDEKVFQKLSYGNKRPSILEVDGDCIKVYPQNSKSIFVFDYSDELYYELENNDYAWYENERGYLTTHKNDKLFFAHWLVVGKPQDGYIVDHYDRDKKNNRRLNLRITTQQINMVNKGIQSNNTSGMQGVSEMKNGKFRSYININGKQKHLGVFDTKEDAIDARLKAEEEYFGEMRG